MFLPDVITACAILHNVLLGQSHKEVEQLLQILRNEGLNGELVDDLNGPPDAWPDAIEEIRDNVATMVGRDKRTVLGIFLTMQHHQHQPNRYVILAYLFLHIYSRIINSSQTKINESY